MEMINLNKREIGILMGALNDAQGYPFQVFEPGVKESKDRFLMAFDSVASSNSIRKEDIEYYILALSQSIKHMDKSTLVALYDNVTLEEIKNLMDKLLQA